MLSLGRHRIQLGDLQIEDEPIGRGGFGTVMRGKLKGYASPVAVKRLRSDETQDIRVAKASYCREPSSAITKFALAETGQGDESLVEVRTSERPTANWIPSERGIGPCPDNLPAAGLWECERLPAAKEPQFS